MKHLESKHIIGSARPHVHYKASSASTLHPY